jgi:hypothetical protein
MRRTIQRQPVEQLARPVPPAEPSKPPVEPSKPPVEIALGQTIDQVVASLGSPKQIVKLGPKQIYVYSDIKITFVDGKVSDVQ